MEASDQKVLYCDFEMSDKQFENRYSREYENHYPFDDNFLRVELDITNSILKKYSNLEAYILKTIEENILENGVQVIIVDNISYLVAEMEKSKGTTPLMHALKKICREHRVSFLVLAHTPKRDATRPIGQNDIAGSKSLINFADSCFGIGISAKEEGLRYLKQVKVRNAALKYGGSNVAVCKLEKPDNFLGFQIGTSKRWHGSTVFYQIDYSEKVRQGKVILYDPDTCKRIKDPTPRITSVHALLQKSEEMPEYCYFGEHQLSLESKDKPVALVESEKTAVIMTGFFPSYIWIVTGSKSPLRPGKCNSFKMREIVLYPDLGAYIDWKKKSEMFREKGFDLYVSDLLETKTSLEDQELGFDIADYFIKNKLDSDNSGDIVKRPDTLLQKFLKKNSALGELIRKFDCVEGQVCLFIFSKHCSSILIISGWKLDFV